MGIAHVNFPNPRHARNFMKIFADQIRPTDEDTYSPGAGQWFIYAATK